MIEFCRRYRRGKEAEGAVLNTTGIRLLLVQGEVLRTRTVLEVRREKEHT